ncbi:MAG TPA: hypothetical protein VG204_01455 [Terriglobia bacterium]|nr:hypothetical protein [Terriglobia bacterium]
MRLLRSAAPMALATFPAFLGSEMAGLTPERRAVTPPITTPATGGLPERPPATCPVSRPPSRPFVPPAPYPAKPGEGAFWFGTAKLWTGLPVDGAWRGLGHYSPTTPGFRQKIFWWREGYYWLADPTPELKVTGRRLDGPAPPFVIPRATNGYKGDLKSFMLVGADIPTYGCWEITGQFKWDKLTFVIWVGP